MAEGPRILIAAGGTGGHVMPAATIAGELKSLRPGADFLFVGTGRPAENEILNPLGYERRILKVPPLAGRSPLKAIWSLGGLFRSLIGAISIVRAYKPDICLAFGGYVCGPVGLAAKMFGLPLVLHEQNSAPGLTNRWLGRLADLVMVGFPGTEDAFLAKRVVYVGNPVRKAICSIESGQTGSDRPPLILVVGGSQGARRLNQAVMDLVEKLFQKKIAFRLIHQTGPDMLGEVKTFYQRLGVSAEVEPFISDMAGAYAQANLAITRAGALTLAELLAARLPAVLVPLPTAAGDHQTINARQLESLGLARLVPEAEIDKGTLEKAVTGLLNHPDELLGMAAKAKETSVASGEVGQRMARLVLDVLDGQVDKDLAGAGVPGGEG